MRPKRTAVFLAVAALFVGCRGNNDLGEVRVMTYNLAVGIDLDTIFRQPTLLGVMQQAEIAWGQKDTSDFAVRAKAVAAQIEAARPDLVGLQEVAQYYSQLPPDGPPAPYGAGTVAPTLAKDFLVILMAELQARGLDYVIVSDGTNQGVVTNADVEVTGADVNGTPTADYRIVDREAVLARSGIRVDRVRTGTFGAHIAVPIPGLPAEYPYYRSWVAVDAAKNGKAFTFLSTHLDPFDPRVQGAQARELLGVVSPSTPTVVVGDMNSDPADVAWPAHGILVSPEGGFTDTAAELGAGAPSCCRDAVCIDPNAALTRRVDLVLHSPHFQGQGVALHGAAASDFQSGLWPADHAGVSAVLGLE